MPRLSPGETARKVMSYLSKKNLQDGVTKYRIWKDNEQLSRSTVYDTIEELRGRGLLRRKEAGETPTGQKKYYFAPTFEGLLMALHLDSRLRSDVDEIASKQVEILPLVFGKWDRLMRNERVRDVLLPELDKLFKTAWRWLVEPAQKSSPKHKESELPLEETNLRREIYERLFTPKRFKGQDEEVKREFIEAIIGDSELSEYVSQLSRVKKPQAERNALNYEVAIDSIENKNPEDFVNPVYSEKWDKESEYFLFSREAKGAESDLDQENISEQIRDIFRSEYCPLPEGSFHITKGEDYWEIPGREPPIRYITKVEDGELSVFGGAETKLYRLTLRLEERIREKK